MSRFKFNKPGRSNRGFTLLEVLAALAVISITLVALYSALSQSTRLTSRVEERMVGNWVASNSLTELSAATDWPDIGENNLDVQMAGRTWYVLQNIKPTEDENVRRIEVIVSLDDTGKFKVASLFGYFLNPKPKLVEDDQLPFTN